MLSPAAAASIKETSSSSSLIVPDQTCQRFTLAQIEAATNKFDEVLVIGRGGFGNVYKSLTNLGSANEVAIKRLQSTSSQGANEFEAEVKLLSKLHHGNLVPLIGYCCEGKEMVLAYEFMPNGTLEDHLHRGVTKLSWLRRLMICIGVARALDYLHTGTSTQHGVIHRDVKTSNILLDSNFAAKVSDFGLAKVGTINQTRTHVSTLVKGTHGYMDPCYFYSGQLTIKSDVYAFGVVLLEVVTGKKAVDPTLDEDQWSLAVWAQDHIKEGRLDQIVDHRLMGPISKKCLKEFASIAVNCLHDQPKRRPTMAEIVVKLDTILSRERASVGFGANDRRFFNKLIYFFSGKADLMQARSASEIIAKKSNNPRLRTFTYTDFKEDEEMLVLRTELQEGPQPVQRVVSCNGTQPIVGQPEVSNTTENQAVEELQASRFTWTVENFSRQTNKKLYSDVFVVGEYKWRVLIYPRGNNVDRLSMYLDVADSSSLPYGWSRNLQLSLAVVNQIRNKFTIKKEIQHQFHAMESDLGFTSFMALSKLTDPSRGYLINDTCIIEADVAVRKVIDDWTYDSKKETGYVGLKNQGATAYMNVLLQTWYHIPYFRKAIHHMPTENDTPSESIPSALQILFYKLQYNETTVAAKELAKSFKMDKYGYFTQYDVQELNRVLCENLEDKMKGTVVEGTMQKLFEGHHMNYIKCVNMDFKSTRKESFYDLQLDVKGCRDVYASFDKYVQVERLEGENKYHAEAHGLQDAKKGVLFIDFPPVLQLHLKRFEYDFKRDTMVKINDRYEFPLELDLDRENGKYVSPDADKSIRNLYTLHSVLVHSGGMYGGHYYVFIRPTLSEQWFKFDDERVTKEDMKRVLDEQYGGEEELPHTNPGYNNAPFKFTKYSNAYMLVYIRKSDKDKIICDVDEKDIAEHLTIRLKKEQEKKDKRRYKAQAHIYSIIKVARDADLFEQIGKDIYFDLVDHDKVFSFRVQKQMPFSQFKEEVAKQFGVPVQFQRFWIWAKRENQTYRPDCTLLVPEKTQSVGRLCKVFNKKNNVELRLFLEIDIGPDLHPLPLPYRSEDDILLFFKLYDPEKEELRYVGRFFVKSYGKPAEIILKLNERAGFSPEEEIELYEEVNFKPRVICELLDSTSSFESSQLQDGDIICFQKRPKAVDKYKYPDVPSFLEYVKN
ncbi:hypothetical protein QVD17_36388 [Tagetes erecta]|uniref:ubiquitinyl hydrolase 1 n=1 Tax=Tagetes erecta TaxID=13708 RepID=A0AAD8JUU6_TARER|nr:hypothetical protein QVD17_36388 [Tagetes erecta]